jgi:hypothetical protein
MGLVHRLLPILVTSKQKVEMVHLEKGKSDICKLKMLGFSIAITESSTEVPQKC